MLASTVSAQVSFGGNVAFGGNATADTRARQVQTFEYITVNASSSFTIFSQGAGTQGTITHIHVTLGPNGDKPNIVQNSTLGITCDGGTTQTVDLGSFFPGFDLPAPYEANNIANTQGSSTAATWSANRRTEINYTNGCTIVFTNASSSSSTVLFTEIENKTGTPTSRPSRQHWHAYLTSPTSVTQYANLQLLPTITSSGGGEIESITLFYSNTGDGSEEGNPSVVTDGNIGVKGNGTEDFFGGGYTCTNGKGGEQSGKWGCWYGSGYGAGSVFGSQIASFDWMGYRFFNTDDLDNAYFTSTLQVNWPNGQSGEGSAPPTATARGLVTYWTAN